MKKIGLYLGSTPNAGGTFQYNLAMLEAVASLPKASFNVVVAYNNKDLLQYIMPYNLESKYIPSDIAVNLPFKLLIKICEMIFSLLRLPLRYSRYLRQYYHPFDRKFVEEKCDLWIFPSQDYLSYYLNVPALSTIHDLMHRYEPRFPEVSSEYEVREEQYFNICQLTKGILVDSEVGRQQAHESYKMPLEKIFVLPYVAPKYIYELKPVKDFEGRYNLPEKFIFYPAQFWEHKNHMNLLKSVALLLKECPDLNLVLVGAEKNGYENVNKIIEVLQLKKHVHIFGYVPNDDIAEFYRRARALVMPTFFGPTNIPPLEAFALGCPVAVSNIYAMPEQVGDAALLFNPESVEEIAHCIQKLWVDDNLCKTLIAKGKERASNWGQKQFNSRLIEIITAIT